VQVDIGDGELVANLLSRHQPRAIVDFAAESHVDRSIHGPEEFIQTNIVGTFRLLEAVRAYWNGLQGEDKAAFRFLHVPTDEVVREPRPQRPGLYRNAPLRAQQPVFGRQSGQQPPGARRPSHLRPAGAHHQLQQRLRPLHFPEKLIPLMIVNALAGKPANPCRSMATACRCATDSTSRTTAAPAVVCSYLMLEADRI